MPTLTSLTVDLRGDASSLVSASRRGLAAVQNLTRGVGGTIARVGGLATAITGLVGTAGLVALGKQAASNVDRIGKLSTQLGVTATEVQKLELVAELSGTSIDNVAKALQRTARVAGEARQGSAAAADAFAALGISVADLERLTPAALFERVVGALGRVADLSLRGAIANRLFGRQWQELNPLIEGFAGNMARAAVVFDDLKFGLGDGARGVEELNDHLTVAQTMMVAFRDLVFAKLAPSLSALVVQLGRMAEEWVRSAGGADRLAEVVAGRLLSVIPQATRLWRELEVTLGGIGAAFDAVVASVTAAAAGVGAFAAAARGVVGGDIALINAAIPGASEHAARVAEGKSVEELERQTALLRDIRDNNFGLVFQ